MAIPQVGAVGLNVVVTIKDQDQAPLDLSATTVRVVYLRRPNGRVTLHSCFLVTTGTDGRMVFATVAGDLDVPGEWTLQARIQTATSTDYYSDVQPFRVAENIAP